MQIHSDGWMMNPYSQRKQVRNTIYSHSMHHIFMPLPPQVPLSIPLLLSTLIYLPLPQKCPNQHPSSYPCECPWPCLCPCSCDRTPAHALCIPTDSTHVKGISIAYERMAGMMRMSSVYKRLLYNAHHNLVQRNNVIIIFLFIN